MEAKNLLVITNSFPDKENKYVGDVFVKEQVKYLKNYFGKVYVISPVAYGVEYLRKTKHEDYEFDNVQVRFPKYVNLPLFYFYFRDFWIYLEKKAILKLIQKERIKFDLIHAHFTWPSGAVAVGLKKEFEVPVVITEHTHITLYKELKRKNKQYIRTWGLCDAIIRVNKKDIPLFVEAGVSPNKVFHIVNGYDPHKFKPVSMDEARERLGLEKDREIILHISRLHEEKGQKYLIEAIKKNLEYRKDVLCFIGGSGPLKDELQKQINDSNLQDHVKLIGFVPDELLSIWMNACDLFVLPSLRESFGIVQIEAMACGKPVVATYNGGSEEIITSDDYGFLVEPANSDELADNILIALSTDWDDGKIREYAEQFRWENIVKEITQVYRKAGVVVDE
jgi:glycosyltransferase involved in cell wall biosynthesis